MGFRASTSVPTPLAELQNFQGPLKSSQSKIGAVVPTPSEPSSQLPKRAESTMRHVLSPPKRARLRPAEGKCAAYALDCDADDEKILLARIESRHAMQTPTQIPIKEAQVRHLQTTKSHQKLWKTSPVNSIMFQVPYPKRKIPSKARAIRIIPRIKANMEIQAATQAQQERNLSLLGLTDDGSDLFDVPKMDSPESDESGFELELDTIVQVWVFLAISGARNLMKGENLLDRQTTSI
ncbi:hypothetical protein BU17DRAFT_94999 [Hysterangium stoloniferum]|nr:hypothetical protein BU17DRAFT_94999 [Hysterangium stoloniferum]